MCQCNHVIHRQCECTNDISAIVRIDTGRDRTVCRNCANAIGTFNPLATIIYFRKVDSNV